MESVTGVEINGIDQNRIYNTSNIYIQGVDSEDVMSRFGSAMAISNGSACTSATIEPSHVLLGIGYSQERVTGSFRFSFGRDNTKEQVDKAISIFVEIVNVVRSKAQVS